MSGWGIAGVAAVMAVGLVGTVLPFVPGLPLIWAAGLVYGLIAGFGAPGAVAFTTMTVLLVGGMAASFVLPAKSGAASGAPVPTLAAGAVGAIAGFFLIPVVGLPVGAVAGVLLAEYGRTSDWPTARRSTKAVVIGFGLGALAELSAGMLMVACWVVWVLL